MNLSLDFRLACALLLLLTQCKALEQLSDEQCLLQVSSKLQRRSAGDDPDPFYTAPNLDEIKIDGTVDFDFDGKALANKELMKAFIPEPLNRSTRHEHRQQQLDSAPLVDLHHFHSGPPEGQTVDNWSLSDTIHLVSAIVVLLLLDLLIANKMRNASWTFRFHVVLLSLMLVLSAAYALLVWQSRGQTDATAWILCYILEIVLSMDNLWIFMVIFRTYRIHGDEMRWALTVGLYGAMILRVPLTLMFVNVLRFDDAVYVTVGALLVVLGMLALDNAENEDSVHNFCVTRVVKWCFGSHYQEPWNKEDEPKNVFFYNYGEADDWCASTLFIVVCMIPFVDLVFALDSTGSKTGDYANRYINLSSSLLAIFTLRSMFFIVDRMEEYIDLLKYGMCAILFFSGVQMMRYHGAQLPLTVTTFIVTAIFLVSVAASYAKIRAAGEGEEDEDSPGLSSLDENAEDAEEDAEDNLDSTGGGADAAGGTPREEKRKRRTHPEAEDKWAVLDTPRSERRLQDSRRGADGSSGGCTVQ